MPGSESGAMSARLHGLWQASLGWAWAGLAFLLPVTSLPLLVRLVRSDTVAAPSGVFLLYLVLAWLLPYLLGGGTLGRQSLPLAGFGLCAAAAFAAASFIDIPPFKETAFVAHELQALFTLAVGVCFYLVVSAYLRTPQQLAGALRWINWGGALMLAWSLVQAAAWYRLEAYPEWMEVIHRSISTSVLFKQRVAGLALEPSWHAHQLNMLYLPLWLAATANRYSAHRWRVLGLTLENLLLGAGAAALFLTLSRVGLAAFVLMAGYLLARAALRFSAWLQARWVWGGRRAPRRWMTALIFLLLVAFSLAALWGLAYGMSRVDPRMAQVFVFQAYQDNTILRYAQRLDFGPRLAYWMAGWEIFNDYPLLGVGLGNAGYFFPQKITPYGWNLMEVSEMMYRSPALTNIKSLWVRLLAETGLLGFSFFAVWLFLHWVGGAALAASPNRLLRTAGTAGMLALIGLLLEGFSVDSFALPYLWCTLGLSAAALRLAREGGANQ